MLVWLFSREESFVPQVSCSVEKNPSFHRFSADWALGHPVPAHLTGPVTAQEDHVLQPNRQMGG